MLSSWDHNGGTPRSKVVSTPKRLVTVWACTTAASPRPTTGARVISRRAAIAGAPKQPTKKASALSRSRAACKTATEANTSSVEVSITVGLVTQVTASTCEPAGKTPSAVSRRYSVTSMSEFGLITQSLKPNAPLLARFAGHVRAAGYTVSATYGRKERSMTHQQAAAGAGMPLRDFVGYGRTPPDVRWPDGARLVVNIVLNYESGRRVLAARRRRPQRQLGRVLVPDRARGPRHGHRDALRVRQPRRRLAPRPAVRPSTRSRSRSARRLLRSSATRPFAEWIAESGPRTDRPRLALDRELAR